MTPRSPVLVLAFLLVALVPAGSASVDQCSLPVKPTSRELPPMAVVVGSSAWMDGSCAGTGVVGAQTATCAPAVGQLCAGTYPAGALVECQWQTTPGSTVVALAIGVDATGDGNVWDNADPDLGLDRPVLPPLGAPRQFVWHVPAAGTLILYPVSAIPGGAATDVTLASCA